VIARVTFPPGPSLSLVFGFHEENLRELEETFNVRVTARGNQAIIRGARRQVESAVRFLEVARNENQKIPAQARPGRHHNPSRPAGKLPRYPGHYEAVPTAPAAPIARIIPRGPRQEAYIEAIRAYDVVFGVGPAGTGKTYLAVSCAIAALAERRVERIILTRPVVEAGERLGFLPGDIREKVDPYMRPLHDALKDMLDHAAVHRMVEQEVIEIAPLAFMRGRTLNKAFVILDEAQNTSIEQMKMFLTRLGNASKAVVTGDTTQVDLPKTTPSGLIHAISLLKGMKGTDIIRFLPADVVRHELVQRILSRYEAENRKDGSAS
jgi:phosphate starvation-inducible PhoH-like protein